MGNDALRLTDQAQSYRTVFRQLDLWGFYLLPNDRVMARRFYEAAKKDNLIEKPDGTAYMVLAPGMREDHQFMTVRTLSMANELGDAETVEKMRTHVEAHYEPTWDREKGEFYYVFGLREPYPRGQYNANIMVAEVGGPDAWWRLYNEPNLGKFHEPTVYGVDYPSMGLSQAYYEQEKKTLVLHTYAADPAANGRPTSFPVKNVKHPGSCRVLVDDAEYPGWAEQNGEIEICTAIGSRSFHVVEP